MVMTIMTVMVMAVPLMIIILVKIVISDNDEQHDTIQGAITVIETFLCVRKYHKFLT